MSLVDFLKTVGKLKKTKRTGWIVAGVKKPESVAEHSFRLAILAMVMADKFKVDGNKLVKMALIHDLAESVVGDLVLERGTKTVIDPKKKLHLEKKALEQIFANIGNSEDYLRLWEEFQYQKSKESQLLKQLDKFEMVTQALEYEEETDSQNLDEFWVNTRKHLKDPELLLLLEELSELRDKIHKKNK